MLKYPERQAGPHEPLDPCSPGARRVGHRGVVGVGLRRHPCRRARPLPGHARRGPDAGRGAHPDRDPHRGAGAATRPGPAGTARTPAGGGGDLGCGLVRRLQPRAERGRAAPRRRHHRAAGERGAGGRRRPGRAAARGGLPRAAAGRDGRRVRRGGPDRGGLLRRGRRPVRGAAGAARRTGLRGRGRRTEAAAAPGRRPDDDLDGRRRRGRRAAAVPAVAGHRARHRAADGRRRRRLPGGVPDRCRVPDLGVRPDPHDRGPAGRHHVRDPAAGGRAVLGAARGGTRTGRARRRSAVPRRRRRRHPFGPAPGAGIVRTTDPRGPPRRYARRAWGSPGTTSGP